MAHERVDTKVLDSMPPRTRRWVPAAACSAGYLQP